MSTGLIWLGCTLFLALAQIFLAAAAKRQQDSTSWAMGNRDGELPHYTGVAARLSRAQQNLFETLPIFIGAVLLAHVSGHDGRMVAWGAGLYFWARVLYVPAYAYGWGPRRTMIWFVSILGLLLVFAGLL
ncbi:MAPEG family protein [Gluconobacter wancherniae]|uniref:Membrane protein n=1 Tax=Gluconobacter wancherniae NBRC 103581 TaxID=656744 RepID=A0A511AWE6_9PROT|nr:MAPEG family protein [Gluconobacter wancherniae]MBF0852709.1 hypothetical protein [Gluconobacter wancherniae]GBD56578.1 membrane protein [Gluconobacter wancherniae NBRC 103581]GBR64137.1 hypothetical protein AA103581_1164 [Gluconobacter wancherniae NBRC 103581]GEK92520.1 membrane protein [Gluconobacter wancherniae NBRC 103581]